MEAQANAVNRLNSVSADLNDRIGRSIKLLDELDSRILRLSNFNTIGNDSKVINNVSVSGTDLAAIEINNTKIAKQRGFIRK